MATPLSTEEFQIAVYMAVQEVPPRKLSTYGHIGSLIHHPRHARHVGKALRALPNAAALATEFNDETVPWWRVINSSYKISPRNNGDGGLGAQRQAERLMEEGFTVNQNEMGEWVVRTVDGDGRSLVWNAIVLPSEVEDEDGAIAHEDS